MPVMRTTTHAHILDGKVLSQAIIHRLQGEIATLKAKNKPIPKLVVVLVGDNAASQVYVNRKAKIAGEVGINAKLIRLPAQTTQATLLETIDQLNQDNEVNAILVQLPLPKAINETVILNAVSPNKDVDGFHPMNLGRLLSGDPPPALPCTPKGMMTMLAETGISIAGKLAVVVGRSNIVGKPMAQLLLAQDATVTLCHSHTKKLAEICRQADILVAAVGRPKMITADHVKEGAVVLDVGINRMDDKSLVGDVDFTAVSQKAGWITPVPGGVGPMTIASLMENTLALYHCQQQATATTSPKRPL